MEERLRQVRLNVIVLVVDVLDGFCHLLLSVVSSSSFRVRFVWIGRAHKLAVCCEWMCVSVCVRMYVCVCYASCAMLASG